MYRNTMFVVSTSCVTLIVLSGCAMMAPVSFAGSSRLAEGAVGFQDLRSSLFPSDQMVLSNEALEKVLDSRINIPAKARIAVIRVGAQQWGFWSEDLAKLDEANNKRFLETLRGCPRVATANILPSILTPPRITIPLLREAAARTQSDLVLLYQTTSRSFSRTRAFAPDETRAYCIVEAFVLDARSGVIPFTSMKTETYAAKKTKGEIDFSETIQKSEMTALGRALDGVATETAAFLAGLPATERTAAQ
jgi:hypothetical protein